MPQPLHVVAITGSTSARSRSQVLAQTLLDHFEQHLVLQPRLIALGDIARQTGAAFSRQELDGATDAILRDIEQADLLIVSTPVYRGALPGQLKHVFDLLGQDALVDTPVLLAATGGSERHALVLEHQLRPLFSFFQALTLPIGVYASDRELADYQVSDDALQARIELAVARALPQFPGHRRRDTEALRAVA